jgi:hypothetical protein
MNHHTKIALVVGTELKEIRSLLDKQASARPSVSDE